MGWTEPHVTPMGNGDILDIVAHQNIRLSGRIFSGILESDHLPVVFHILDHLKTKNFLEPVEKFRDWQRFQSLASDLILPRIEINQEKLAHHFASSTASAYRLSISKLMLSDINKIVRTC
jgi:hypothetical protein